MTTRPDDLTAFQRPNSPNTALYAPAGLSLENETDGTVPTYPKSVADLSKVACKVWGNLKNVKLTEMVEDGFRLSRFVATTPVLRFKDDITVQFVSMENDHSSFIIYSASRIGYSDFGTNKKRVEDWLYRLNEAVRGA